MLISNTNFKSKDINSNQHITISRKNINFTVNHQFTHVLQRKSNQSSKILSANWYTPLPKNFPPIWQPPKKIHMSFLTHDNISTVFPPNTIESQLQCFEIVLTRSAVSRDKLMPIRSHDTRFRTDHGPSFGETLEGGLESAAAACARVGISRAWR